jgi:hypothetical protein
VQALAERERRPMATADVKKELPRLRESIEQEDFFRLLPGYVRRFIYRLRRLSALRSMAI